MFVDYGNIESVDVQQICDLESISEVLSKIPKQVCIQSIGFSLKLI